MRAGRALVAPGILSLGLFAYLRGSYLAGFTPLNKAADEIGGNKLVAVGGLKPPTSDTYLTGFTFSVTSVNIPNINSKFVKLYINYLLV